MKPGRPSSGDLTIVPRVPEPPPEPPASLSEGAAQAWRELFRSVPAHQFNGALHLVEQYAVALHLARVYSAEVEAAKPGKRRDELARCLRAQQTTVALWARTLRLSPKSRSDRKVKLLTTPPGRRPWEIDAPDAS